MKKQIIFAISLLIFCLSFNCLKAANGINLDSKNKPNNSIITSKYHCAPIDTIGDEMIPYLEELARMAKDYYKKHKAVFGDDFGFMGFKIPDTLKANRFGKYSAEVNDDKVILKGSYIYQITNNKRDSVAFYMIVFKNRIAGPFGKEQLQKELLSDNRIYIIWNLTVIANVAQQYYKKTKKEGGSKDSFTGFKIPGDLASKKGCKFFAEVNDQSIYLTGKGKYTSTINGKDTIQIKLVVSPNSFQTITVK